jgi:ribosomal protein S18 acetylase RimI-like enzyme
MHIRPFRPADLEVLRRLTAEAFDGVSIDQNMERRFGPINGRDWRYRKARHIDQDAAAYPQGIFVAEEGDRILGFVTTRVDAEAGVGHVPNLVVAAGDRRRGLGRQLVEYALDYFRALGLTHARIETLEQNARGQRLFTSLGFEEMARQIHFARQLGPKETDALPRPNPPPA